MNHAIVGAMLNSALYLTAVFVAGLTTGNRHAALFAIAALGVTYLSYLAQLFTLWPRFLTADRLVFVSIALGGAAGLSLLI